MQRISRAPELSATRRRVSFWITPRPSSRPLDDVDERPALGARQRAALDHAHDVTLVRVVVLVVCVHGARAAHDLLVAAVAPRDFDAHGDRLLGLVRDDDALAYAALALDRCMHGRERLRSGRGGP